MLNELLLSFFFGMPAVAVIFLARDLRHPLPRALLFWGGIVATGLVAVVLVPMLLCDGTLQTGHAACLGGAGMTAAFDAAQPAIRGAAMVYILAGPPLATLAFLLEWLHRRRAA